MILATFSFSLLPLNAVSLTLLNRRSQYEALDFRLQAPLALPHIHLPE